MTLVSTKFTLRRKKYPSPFGEATFILPRSTGIYTTGAKFRCPAPCHPMRLAECGCLLTAAAGSARSPCRFPYTIWEPACSPRRETGEALPVADEASLFRGRLPISGYAGSADWFEPTVYSLLGYLRAKSRICGGELTCLQQPQASLDLLAVFHIQSGDPFAWICAWWT